jgi:glycosyltransferase involved in cell wall biosynthesis
MTMVERPRILLLIPHLGGGGAERVFALLATGLSRDKYDVHLALVTERGSQAGSVPADVAIHGLGARRVRTAAFSLLQLVRRIKPQVILSGMFHLNFLVLMLRPFFPRATRVLVRQNGMLSASLAIDRMPLYTSFLYRLLYRRADGVICQSEAMARELVKQLGLDFARVVSVPNPIDVAGMRATVERASNQWEGKGPHLLAVGRLACEKGFDLLLRALAEVRAQFPAADLVIAGAGPEESRLKGLCAELGLDGWVRFAGHVSDPAAYFKGATAFVLSSHHEGMPNGLLEAAAAGLPIIAMPAGAGVVDLLDGRPGVWLADEISVEALSSSLMLAVRELPEGERFDHAFIEPFRMERALLAYEQVLDEALQPLRSGRKR